MNADDTMMFLLQLSQILYPVFNFLYSTKRWINDYLIVFSVKRKYILCRKIKFEQNSEFIVNIGTVILLTINICNRR